MISFKFFKVFDYLTQHNKTFYNFCNIESYYNIDKCLVDLQFAPYRADGLKNQKSPIINKYKAESIRLDNKYYRCKVDNI